MIQVRTVVIASGILSLIVNKEAGTWKLRMPVEEKKDHLEYFFVHENVSLIERKDELGNRHQAKSQDSHSHRDYKDLNNNRDCSDDRDRGESKGRPRYHGHLGYREYPYN
jgi:hypothetical protein